MATSPDSKKRVIMTLSRHPVSGYAPIREIGLPFLWSSSNTERPFLVVRTKDLLLLRVVEMTVEGERNTEAVKAATRAKLLREAGGESVTFHEVLM
jgi:hypothetical protein